MRHACLALLMTSSPVLANDYVYDCVTEPAYLGAGFTKSGIPCKRVLVPRDHYGAHRSLETEAGKEHKARRAKENWQKFLEQHNLDE